jgi:2-polyprenyl-3-methyl-5-hydroxy-6-metoxy-1,4-benzoquinol methylase
MIAAEGCGRVAFCPVCGGAPRALLSLSKQPIYQHPVPADTQVPEPYTVDLSWVRCADCAHAWQSEFDEGLLETIYRSHYYTPAPDGIAVQFRNDFLSTVESFRLLSARTTLLEIGASDGDVLAEMKARTGARNAYAFEPNKENATVAVRRGLQVYETFFDGESARTGLEPVDLVYSRHVIEHVFQFADFFAGINAVVSAGADLILETPSLDHHGVHGSLSPFHVEHLHVFSLRSLATLAQRFGWVLRRNFVTADGNLIAAFRRSGAQAAGAVDIAQPQLDGLQAAADSLGCRLRRLVDGRRLVFWGAGSAGVGLACMIGREPDYWTDGNDNKIGKKFPGLSSDIVSPGEAFSRARNEGAGEPLLIIASSFAREILPRVRQMGWDAETVDMTGSRLQ